MNQREGKEQKEKNNYSAEQIQVLEDIEAVRKRPGMYIGSVGEQGVHHLVWEVIDNSIDEAVAGYGNKITIILSEDQKSITITDNGRGIPLEIHSKTRKSTLETIFTVLHSGGKFDHRVYQTSGGLHGVGVTAVNALSSWLKVQVQKDNKLAIQYFEEGVPKFLEILDFKSNKTGTSVEFAPDEKIFKTFDHFNDDIIKSRLKELAYLNPQLTLVFSQALGGGQVASATYHYPGGIGNWINELNKDESLDNTPVFQSEWSNERSDDHYFYLFLALQYNKLHRTVIKSFCNNIKTEDGGTHVAGFEIGLLTICRELIKEKYPSFKLNIGKDDVLEGLTAIVSVRIRDPQFIGQTKDKLSNEEIRKTSREATYDLLQKFLKDNREIAEIILQKIINSASVRAKSEEHLYFLRDARQSVILPGKLSDCISKNTEINEIFIVEGESAGGSAKLGRNRNHQAVLSLKGKVTNAEKLEKTKVLKNDEIKNLINALGFNVTDVFQSLWEISKLRYGKIIIMTDADVDGAHIALLLATFFLKYFPALIAQRKLFLAVSPLYRLQSAKKEPLYFFNDRELSEYRANNSLRNDSIQRFKGLGEMNPQQLKETTMNPEKRVIHELFFSSVKEAEEQINRLMGIKSDERKLLLESGEHRGVQLLVSPDSKVEVSQFALVNFLRYAYMVIEGRALPHINDGLKPVQRRILYTLYQLNILPNKSFKKSAKVIGEVMGKYHPHGDSSIYQAMVKMTQDFNYRYPLIEGQGNFGSIDGDDAGAHRYCFTGDTRVMTDMGLVQITAIPSIVGADNKLNEVKISSSVNSIEGPQNAIKWLYSGVQDILQITTERGYKVSCTPNQPFYILNDNLDFEWKDAEKMLIGQPLSLHRKNQVEVRPGKEIDFFYNGRAGDLQVPLCMSQELAKFLGYLLSNGSLRMTNASLEFGSSDRVISNDFADIARNLFPNAEIKTRTIDPAIGRKIESGLSHFYTNINSTKIIAFLKNLGVLPSYASQKKIPEIIFQSSLQEISAFISAYYESDGSISVNNRGQNLHLHASSIELLEGMKLLLLNYFGIISGRILAEHTINSSYRFSITDGENIVKFREKINFISDRKRVMLSRVTVPNEESGSFIRNLIPNLSPFLTKYFNERRVSQKDIQASSGEILQKQSVFSNFNLAKFGQVKTEFKLAQYLSRWSNEAKQGFPELYRKLSLILSSQYFFDRIVSIKKLDEQLPVYDLTIEKTNAFIANGFVAHNTEARLTPYGLQVLGDIDFGTVDWKANYDETEEEPTILPSLLPNLLLNGSSGVAVGMSTNIPPHNLGEILSASIQLVQNNDLEVSDLLNHIKGPDFPTGGVVINGGSLQEIYERGEGTVYVRCRTQLEDNLITITEIPFKINKVSLVEEVDNLIKRKKIEGLRSVTDYSNWEGINIRIRLESGYEPGIILNQLYKRTSMQTGFSIKLRSLEEEKPRVFNLKEILQSFVNRRLLDIKKKSFFLRKKNSKELKAASVQLFIINNYQEIAEIVKKASTDNERNDILRERFALNQETVNQILDTPSSFRQFSAERTKRLGEKISSLNTEQSKLSELIEKEAIRKERLINELEFLRDCYTQDGRRTDILFGSRSVAEKQLVVKKDRLVILNTSEERRIDLDTGREAKKIHSYLNVCDSTILPATNSPSMGREINKLARGTENQKVLRTNTHADLWCLSNFGKLYIIPVYTLPVQYGKKYGTNLRESGLLKLLENEIITNIITVEDRYLQTTGDKYFLLLTRRGRIKRIELSKIGNIFTSGKRVINIVPFNDEITDIAFTTGNDKVLILTKEGRYKYLDEKLVRIRGRSSYGNIGIRIRENNYDGTVSLAIVKQGFGQKEQLLLGITADNFARKIPLMKIKEARRAGGIGQQAYKTQYKFLRHKKDHWCDLHDRQIIEHRMASCCDKSRGVTAYSSCPIFKKLQKAIKLCPNCQGKFSIKYNPLVQAVVINLAQKQHYIYVLAGKSLAFYARNDFLHSAKSKKRSMFRERNNEQITDIFVTSQIDENIDYIDNDEQLEGIEGEE